jgi:predicted dehydrogenase
MNTAGAANTLNRRCFLQGTAAAGAAWAFAPSAGAAQDASRPEPIHVALLGAGEQGFVLMQACRQIPGVRFQAVCDLWGAYNLRRASLTLRHYGQPVHAYTDYEEMLDQERDLDAVIVATPDFWHARHTIACLNAGRHVYCEVPMSHRREEARRMVEAARATGKLLQIGHQRRSNPRYIFCCEELLKKRRLLGQMIAVNGQWNRMARPPFGWPKGTEIDAAVLKANGFESMYELRNWRRQQELSGGPFVEAGVQQIDVYHWFLGVRPTAVLADGRIDDTRQNTREAPGAIMALYEYKLPSGPVVASYQAVRGNTSRRHFEKFLGNEGTLVMSERPDLTRLYPEPADGNALAWARCVRSGCLTAPADWLKRVERLTLSQLAHALSVTDTDRPNPAGGPPPLGLPVKMDKLLHQPHLENFFDAMRGKARLNCPAEVGYETLVTVLKANEAVVAGGRLEFKPGDFLA